MSTEAKVQKSRFSLWILSFATDGYNPACFTVSAPSAFIARKKMIEAFKNKKLHIFNFPYSSRCDIKSSNVRGPGYDKDSAWCDYKNVLDMLNNAYITRVEEEVICHFALDG